VFGFLRKAPVSRGRTAIAVDGALLALAVVEHQPASRPTLARCELLAITDGGSPRGIAEALRTTNLSAAPISLLMPYSQYQLSLVEAPDVPPAELRAAMRWRLLETLDFPVDEAVIDVFDLPPTGHGGHKRMVYAVVARRTQVEQQIAALAGYRNFDAVDIPELALRNLAALLPSSPSGVALLHVGDTAATLVIVRGSTFYLARRISLHKPISLDSESHSPQALDIAGVALELQRSLDYYERNFDQRPIAQIVIAPIADATSGLITALARESGLNLATYDLNQVMECAAPLEPHVQRSCLLAVGAALRVERRTL
jgi:MSHA biogenesis protein MshI